MDIKIRPRLNYTAGRERFDRPAGVRDCAAEFEGVRRTWKECIPHSYDGSKPVPMVVSLHGGRAGYGRNNHHAELTTAWALLAQREGFIVLYPQSITPEESWAAWDDFENDPRTKSLQDDLNYLDWLLERTLQTYNIDRSRVYLHGQSLGDVMGSYYLIHRPQNPFAAAALLSGPVDASRYFAADGSCLFGADCSLPVVRTHGSTDLAMPMGAYQHLGDSAPSYDHQGALRAAGASAEEIRRQKLVLQVVPSNRLWNHINGSMPEPLLSVRGRYNAITWPGRHDFHFYTVEGGGHGPSMDTDDYIWSYFFSGYRLVDGVRVRTAPACQFCPDSNAVVLADGAEYAYVNNHRVSLNEAVRFIEDTAYVSAADLPQLYPNLQLNLAEDGLSVEITDGTQWLQLSASNCTYVWNNHLRHGARTFFIKDTLLIPVNTVAGSFYAQKEKHRDGVSYFSPFDGALSFDFCFLLRQLLGAQPAISTAELYQMNAEILNRLPHPTATE